MKQLPKHSNNTFVQLLKKLDYKPQSTNDINVTTNKNIQLYSDNLSTEHGAHNTFHDSKTRDFEWHWIAILR